MATHSSILAWRIPWTEEPVGLQPMGSQRVRHYWARHEGVFYVSSKSPYKPHCITPGSQGQAVDTGNLDKTFAIPA